MDRVYKILYCGILLLALGCSTHNRTTNPGVTSSQMMSQMNCFMQSDGASCANSASISNSVGDTSSLQTMATDSASVVYFGQGPGPMGTAASIFSFSDYTAFQLPGLDPSTISDVEVFFINDWSQTGLLVAVAQGSSSYTVTSFSSQGSPTFDKSGFSTTVVSSDGSTTLTLTSNDVGSDGNLFGVIQLQVTDGNGNSIGQFSTLVGFAQ